MTEKVSKIKKKFQKKLRISRSGSDTTLDLLGAACLGLIYVSETDAPVRAVAASEVDSDRLTWLKEDLNTRAEAKVEEISVDRFFKRLTCIEDWFGKGEVEQAERFKRLQELLRDNLSDLRAYRVGEINVRYYVVGRDAAGRLMGIETAAVET